MAASSALDGLAADYVRGRFARGEIARTTARNMRFALYRFTEAVACARPGPVEVGRWLEAIGHLKPRTRQKEISDARGFCAWLVEQGHLQADPLAGVRRPRTPRAAPKALPGDDVGRLLAVCPDSRSTLIVTLMAQLGLRRAEVAGLAVEAVDRGAGTVRVVGKGGHERVLPLIPEVAAALDAYLADDPPPPWGPLIRSQVTGGGIGPARVAQIVDRLMRAAGVKAEAGDGRSCHALRHTCAGDVLRAGATLAQVQALLGHSSIATTAVYLPGDTRGLAAVMSGRSYGPAPGEDVTAVMAGVVTDLAGAVAQLRAEVGRLSASPGPAASGGPVRCGLCGQTGPMARYHEPEDHCPDCGLYDVNRSPGRLARHRLAAHGVPYDDGCGWREPHEHSTAGECVCPLCGQTSRDLVYDRHTMAGHLARPHAKCPDCDRSYIRLDAHRRKAHPWAQAQPGHAT